MRNLFCILAVCFSLNAEEFDASIPVINLKELEEAADITPYIEQVRDALHRLGFLAFTNTGIDQEVIHNAFAVAKVFFSLDDETKLKYFAPETNGQRGYIPYESERAKGATSHDLKEYYHIGRDWSIEQLERLGYPANIWPEETPFGEAMNNYLEILEDLMYRLQHVFAQALYQDENFLDEMVKEGEGLLRVVHYPPMEEQKDDIPHFWAAAHTDINLFTILPKGTAEGLEVKLEDGSWMPVFAQEDSIIVNMGDFLEILSNGYYKSAIHRVKAPKESVERYSMVFFVHSRSADVFSPLQEFIDLCDGEKRFATATRWEMFMERLADNAQASDEMLKELGESGIMERLIEVGRASIDAMQALREHGYASEKVLAYLAELESEE